MDLDIDIHAHLLTSNDVVYGFKSKNIEEQLNIYRKSVGNPRFIIFMDTPFPNESLDKLVAFRNASGENIPYIPFSEIDGNSLILWTPSGKIKVYYDPLYNPNLRFLEKTKEMEFLKGIFIHPGIYPNEDFWERGRDYEGSWREVLREYYLLGARVLKVYATHSFEDLGTISQIAESVGFSMVQIHTLTNYPKIEEKIIEEVRNSIELTDKLIFILVHSFSKLEYFNDFVGLSRWKKLVGNSPKDDRVFMDLSGLYYAFVDEIIVYLKKIGHKPIMGSDFPYPFGFSSSFNFKEYFNGLSPENKKTVKSNLDYLLSVLRKS